MNFLFAFIFAAAVGIVGQAIFLLVKGKMPIALIIMFAIGALLSGFGVMDQISTVAPGSMIGMLMNGGCMFFSASAQMISGDPALFFVIWLIIIFMMLIGIASGAIASRGQKNSEEK